MSAGDFQLLILITVMLDHSATVSFVLLAILQWELGPALYLFKTLMTKYVPKLFSFWHLILSCNASFVRQVPKLLQYKDPEQLSLSLHFKSVRICSQSLV